MAETSDNEQSALERVRITLIRKALEDLYSYACNVWFDEATATDEEWELLEAARLALGRMTPGTAEEKP